MNTGFMIITNNPLVKKKNWGKIIMWNTKNFLMRTHLKKVQKMIFQGYRLLTHPLSGSVKPNETPYKSVMLSETPEGLDAQAMQIIASAIQACGKFQFKSDLYKPSGLCRLSACRLHVDLKRTSVGRKLALEKGCRSTCGLVYFEHTTNTFKKGGNLQ